MTQPAQDGQVAEVEHPAFDKLNEKQKQFILHYCECFNAAKAARDAGYSEKCSKEVGYRLFTDVHVRAALDEMLPILGVTIERVKNAIAEMAFDGDIAQVAEAFAGKDLTTLQAEGVPTHLIKSLSVRRRVVGKGDDAEPYEDVRLEMYDRQAALRDLTRILGMVTEHRTVEGRIQHEHSIANDAKLGQLCDAALARLAEIGRPKP